MHRRNAVVVMIGAILLFLCGRGSAAVGYLGPAGTYTEEAAVRFFGESEQIVPVNTVPEMLQRLKAGQFESAVVPVENTIGGSVYPYLDAVIGEQGLAVVGEVDVPIRQTLLVVPGTSLKDIKTVMSHPQGLAQSTGWLKAHLPEARLVEASSTAEAARRVAEGGDRSVAAIAASRAAKLYKLEILATDLQQIQTNITRFWIVTTKDRQTFGRTKAAMVVRGPVVSLPKFLSEMDQKGFKLVAVHDRPAKSTLGQYLFVIEVLGSDQDRLSGVIQSAGSLTVDLFGLYDAK